MIKMDDNTVISLTDKGRAFIEAYNACGGNMDLMDPALIPEDLPEEFVDWEWFVEMDKQTEVGEHYPDLYTSGMIAKELGVSRNRVRNILDNWGVPGPVIHIHHVKLYGPQTLEDVAELLGIFGRRSL